MHEIDWENIVKGGAALGGGIVGVLFGVPDVLIRALIIMVIADYITGLIKAWRMGKIESKIMFDGIARKVLIFGMVLLAVQLDFLLPGLSGGLRATVIFFYIANEGISILENAACMGLPVPAPIKKALDKIKEESGKCDGLDCEEDIKEDEETPA